MAWEKVTANAHDMYSCHVLLAFAAFVFSIFLALTTPTTPNCMPHAFLSIVAAELCSQFHFYFLAFFLFLSTTNCIKLGAHSLKLSPQLGRHTFSTRPPTCHKMSAAAPELAAGKCDTTFCCYYIRI